ncbi:MAG: DUF2306 domain-containing protein, partial [Aestuariivirga sp.]
MLQDFVHENLLKAPTRARIAAIWLWAKRVVLLALAVFLILTAAKAVRETFDNGDFPEALAVKVDLLPIIFPVHMLTGGLALLLVPLALFLRGTRWHKWAGRAAGVDIICAGVTAIPVALTAPLTPVAAAGFSTQALVWMALLAKGYWHIRRRDISGHWQAMVMLAAVTSGAMFFRIYLAFWAIYGSRRQLTIFYGLDSWVAWLLPLIVVVLILKFRPLAAKRTF